MKRGVIKLEEFTGPDYLFIFTLLWFSGFLLSVFVLSCANLLPMSKMGFSGRKLECIRENFIHNNTFIFLSGK